MEEQALRHFEREEVAEVATLWEQAEETVQILQIESADKGWSHHLFSIHLLHHLCLTTIQHLTNVLWYLTQHTLEGQ